MPHPRQLSIILIVSDLITSSKPKLAEFLILPLRGSMACVANFASFAPPAAESRRCNLLTISSITFVIV